MTSSFGIGFPAGVISCMIAAVCIAVKVGSGVIRVGADIARVAIVMAEKERRTEETPAEDERRDVDIEQQHGSPHP